MWFRNLHLYRLTTTFELSPEELSEKLAEKRFAPCGRQAEESLGWVSPIHRSRDYLVHSAGGCTLICMRREQKVIPILSKLFASSDRGIRRGLLENINSFGSALPDSLVESQIYPSVQSGFTDTNPYLRELTLKSMAVLGSKLSAKTNNP